MLDEEEAPFEDRLVKQETTAGGPQSPPHKPPPKPKRKKVEWQGVKESTEGDRPRPKRAVAGGRVKGEPVSKKRKANAVASLPPPPPFPVVPLSSYPPFPSISPSTPFSALSSHLASYVESVSTLQSTALADAYQSSSADPFTFLSHYTSMALQGWTIEVQKAMADEAEASSKGKGPPSSSSAEADTVDSSLPLYSHLATVLSSTLEQYKQYTASLTTAAAVTPPLTPTLPAAAVSSASGEGLPALIRQGYSALSVSSDVLIGELRGMKEEVEKHKAWRETVSAKINQRVIGEEEGGEDAGEEEGLTRSGKRKRDVKKIIKDLTKDLAG